MAEAVLIETRSKRSEMVAPMFIEIRVSLSPHFGEGSSECSGGPTAAREGEREALSLSGAGSRPPSAAISSRWGAGVGGRGASSIKCRCCRRGVSAPNERRSAAASIPAYMCFRSTISHTVAILLTHSAAGASPRIPPSALTPPDANPSSVGGRSCASQCRRAVFALMHRCSRTSNLSPNDSWSACQSRMGR